MNVQGFDSTAARQALVDCQVRVNDVTNKRIIRAFRHVPREAFVPKSTSPAVAYSETEVETAPGRWLWRARDSAKLLQAVEPAEGQSTLVIGAGLGYTAALFSDLGMKVTVLEADDDRANAARAALSAAGFASVETTAGDLKAGIPGRTFDVIYVDGAAAAPEKAWLDQLSGKGRLGLIVRDRAAGHARLYRKGAAGYSTLFEAAPPMLPELEPAPAFTF
ncbi:MAG: protein-L-isoaspartate O-methyltransferase [Caulobacterales bacterium]